MGLAGASADFGHHVKEHEIEFVGEGGYLLGERGTHLRGWNGAIVVSDSTWGGHLGVDEAEMASNGSRCNVLGMLWGKKAVRMKWL